MLDRTPNPNETATVVEGLDQEAPLIAALVATLLAHQRRQPRPDACESQAPDSWRLVGLWQQFQGPASG
jgi:hypothetical protein